MEMLNVILPVLLYIAGIILLIVLTILGIRLIKILDKVDNVVDNIENKVNSVNSLFDIINKASDGLSLIGESIVGSVIGWFSGILSKKNKDEEDYYE